MIFTALIGLEKYLFFKADEHDDGDYFFASKITQEAVQALKDGRLSVRGALWQDHIWMLDLNLDWEVRRYQSFKAQTVSEILPPKGVGISSEHKKVADTLQQADSALSFRFFGNELQEGAMPFSVFKNLIDNVYRIIKNAFMPTSLASGRGSSLISIPIRQPNFSSLLIAMDEPVFEKLRAQKSKAYKDIDFNEIDSEIDRKGKHFFEKFEEAAEAAAASKFKKSFVKENFELIKSVQDILPRENAAVSNLEVSSHLHSVNHHFQVNIEAGEIIRRTYKEVKGKDVTLSGVVVSITSKQRTFVLQSEYGKEVTCHVASEFIDPLIASSELKIGRKVKVTGEFTKRKQRGLLLAVGAPFLI